MAITANNPIPGSNISVAQWGAKVVTDLTSLDSRTAALEFPSFVALRATVGQTIPTGTWTALTLDTEEFDASNWHSTSGNTSRLSPTAPCKLVIIGTGTFFVSAVGNRGVRVAKNGSPVPGRGVFGPPSIGSEVWSNQATAILSFNGTTDYAEIQGYQATGGNLGTFTNAEFAPAMQAYLIARG